jgi:4-aminobutyrate aminotransferase
MNNELPHLSRVWWKSGDLAVESGSGMYLYTEDGRQLLDFTSGVGVTSTGHSHPVVVEALHQQMSRVMHAQVNLMSHSRLAPATEALNRVTPDPIDQFFLTNSGAEAVEAAVKLAKHATGRQNLIVFERGFHGRTAQTMAMTMSKSAYRASYAPLPAGIFTAPLPYPFRSGLCAEDEVKRCLDGLDMVLRGGTAPQETAAIVIETVVGEGGYIVHDKAFIRGLRERCDEHGILLIFDEIQSGVGRTGRWFAFEHYDVIPDILVLGKGVGSGFPVACIGASTELMDKWVRGSHGGTYGANPVACAAIEATLGVIEDEKLVENAAQRGTELLEGLKSAIGSDARVGEIRGLGLMVGIEFVGADGRPDAALTASILAACLSEDILLISCGIDGNVIRLVPALVVTSEEVTRVVESIARALQGAEVS